MSFVNHEHKHIFVHVPKTAGTSMERRSFVGGSAHAGIKGLLNKHNKDYFKWAFVRNPFDRLVSFHTASQQHSKAFKEKIPESFTEFALRLDEFSDITHLQPQVDFLCIGDKLSMDFIGKYESLHRDWNLVCRILKIKDSQLPRLNKSDHPHWATQYNRELKLIVAKFYREDFSRLQYDISIPERNQDD